MYRFQKEVSKHLYEQVQLTSSNMFSVKETTSQVYRHTVML